MFLKLLYYPAVFTIRLIPLAIVVSLALAIFYCMSFSLWGPYSHGRIGLFFMAAAILLTFIATVCYPSDND